MSLQRIASYLLFSFALAFISEQAHAQHQPERHSHRVMQKIDAAHQAGRITLDQKVLYKFYAGLKREKLPVQFKISEREFVKCGTPAQIDFIKYKDQLSNSTVNEIESLISDTSAKQAQQTYLSPSGKFMLHYETAGSNAVPAEDANGNNVPDYVEWTAAAADSSWRHQVATLDYTDPILPSNPYEIGFSNFDNHNIYGQAVRSDNTTYIEIHNTFENFPPNTDPEGNVIGAIKATMAHEFKHAIQYAATQWSGESDRWAEMDATLMEEVVYDNVNDYYNYLTNSSSIFENPQNSFYPGSYYHVSWALYFEEKFGPDFWPNVWKRIKENPGGIDYTEAIQDELGGAEILQENYVESHLWHFASGSNNSSPFYGFEEREEYPDPTINQNYTGKDSSVTTISLQGFAANYIELGPGQETAGFIRIELSRTNPGTGLGIIAYLKNGETQQQIATGGGNGKIKQQTPWKWTDINRLGIIVANGHENGSDSYRIAFTSDIPEEITLSQNYPNPFNPGTTIPFDLNQQSRVQIKIYDITGKLVNTLIDEERPAGFYFDVRFNGSNLASGVYFYQLVTDQKVLSKKMTLIK